LASGTKLGPYEIVALLGAGGMGEVYRARDSKLKREVALKVVPANVAGDRERLTRFQREAEVLASLNHPHIAQIYGLEQAGEISALVMELVEGEDLSRRLARGPIPVEDALAIAKQIADALENAHEQGIIHRDLKPANIMIRSDGTVKVLDFGLAKAIARTGAESAVNEAPTATATELGALLGTVTYMSPEQARGIDVTTRSDIWAFGVILFEMLAGRRPFNGVTQSDVLASILQTVPDWGALPPQTPLTIRRLVQRCLERDPKARVHDIGDARLEIEDAGKMLGVATQSPPGAKPLDTGFARRPVPRAALMLAALAALAGIVTTAYVLGTRRGPVAEEVRLQMPPPAGTHFVSVPALSPDGRQIVFVGAPDTGGRSRLWSRRLSATDATPLAGTDDATYPFWSPDGRSVAFFADGKLKRLNVAGGGPIVVCDAPAGRGGSWLDDDSIVFAPSQFSPLMRVSSAGGVPAAFTTLADDETGHRFPQRLPRRHLVYFSPNRAPAKNGTRLISVDAPERAVNFFTGMASAEYVNDRIMFIRPETPGSLLAQRVTLPGGQLDGEPIAVGRARISETFGRHVMSTSAAGVVAFLPPPDALGQFTWMSRDGRVLETVGTPEAHFGVELSPDRQRLATVQSSAVWTLDLARPVASRLSRVANRHPMWSPDGTRIASVYQGRGDGTFDLELTATSTGSFTPLFQQGAANLKPVGWTRDGKMLVFIQTVDKSTARSIWTMPVNDPQKAAPYLQDAAQNLEARLSPDNKWIAYATDRSGRFEVEVQSFPTPGVRHQISLEGGGYPRWRADGRELYFLSADSRVMAVAITPGDPPAFGRPTSLFEVKLVAHPDRANFGAYEYDVNADGSRFLINRQVAEPVTSMTIIVDWTPQR
jgi:Tol biopolymer transport system component